MLETQIMGFDMAFVENLRRLRRDQGLTQEKLAELSGVKASHIPRLEKDNSNPNLNTIYSLMTALNCSADELLSNKADMSMNELLQTEMERANRLPEQDMMAVIHFIDRYCMAHGMESLINENSKKWLGFMKPSKPIDPVIKEINS